MISIEDTIKDIQNPIFKRGEQTFLTKIHAAVPSLTPSALYRATLLCAAFHGNIAAMPVDGSYAAVRLASAVISVSFDEGTSDEELVASALRIYSATDPATQPAPRTVVARHFAHQDDAVHGNFGRVVEVKADATTKELIASAAIYEASPILDNGTAWDVIDLLDDIDASELSTEGKRKLGLVDANFNSLTDVDEVQAVDSRVYGSVTMNSENEVESVTCPHCGKQDVYAVAHAEYGCFQCGEEFPVKLWMSDIHGE